MGGLKEDIKHEILLKHCANIMEVMQSSDHIKSNNKDTHKSTMGAYIGCRDCFWVHKTIVTQSKSLTPE
jgi:hypothetical protein